MLSALKNASASIAQSDGLEVVTPANCGNCPDCGERLEFHEFNRCTACNEKLGDGVLIANSEQWLSTTLSCDGVVLCADCPMRDTDDCEDYQQHLSTLGRYNDPADGMPFLKMNGVY